LPALITFFLFADATAMSCRRFRCRWPFPAQRYRHVLFRLPDCRVSRCRCNAKKKPCRRTSAVFITTIFTHRHIIIFSYFCVFSPWLPIRGRHYFRLPRYCFFCRSFRCSRRRLALLYAPDFISLADLFCFARRRRTRGLRRRRISPPRYAAGPPLSRRRAPPRFPPPPLFFASPARCCFSHDCFRLRLMLYVYSRRRRPPRLCRRCRRRRCHVVAADKRTLMPGGS